MVPLAWIPGLGFPELLLILGILVLLFGARKIPDLARALGEGIRNFRGGMRDDDPGREDDEKPGVQQGTEKQ